MAKSATRAPRGRLSQSEKISKRLRGIKAGVGLDAKKAVHTVNVYAMRVPVTLNGFLVSYDETGVVFRHKKTNASKKTRISTFLIRDVVKVFGKPGEPSSITLIKSELMYTVKGLVRRDAATGTLTVKDSVTGEITTIFSNDNVHIEVFADEEDNEKSSRKAKKKKPVEEDFDEEDEDLEDEEEDEDDEEDEDLDDEEDEDLDDEEDEDDDEEEDDDLDDEDL